MAQAPLPPTQPPPPATAMLDITVQGSYLTRSIMPPTVSVNGIPTVTGYGRHTVPVAPGPTRIDVVCQWLWSYGRASMEVEPGPGQTVPVFYSMPAITWADGRIGHEPQKRSGKSGLVALFVGLLLLAVFVPAAIAWIVELT